MQGEVTDGAVEGEHALLQRFWAARGAIEAWFAQAWQRYQPPLYGSVDVRFAGFKLAPVDTNLYPGGFNNVDPADLSQAVAPLGAVLRARCPQAQRILLIPEGHTRNPFYGQHLLRLVHVLRQTGLTVRLGALYEVPDAHEWAAQGLDLPRPEALVRHGDRLGLADYDPCVVVLNNDLSGGIPAVLRGLQGQCLLPPLHAGWVVRRKSQHFAAYDTVAQQLSTALDLDPWWINPYFEACGQIDFHTRTGEDALAQAVARVLQRTQAQYDRYGISAPPFVMVKADAGTYGMGILSVRHPDEVRNLSRRQRNKMAVIKEGLAVSEVLIQEGVLTIDRVADGVAEPVVYLAGAAAWGGFYRVHAQRSVQENLNAAGAFYVPYAGARLQGRGAGGDAGAGYAYGVVARLAMVAAALELEQTDPTRHAGEGVT